MSATIPGREGMDELLRETGEIAGAFLRDLHRRPVGARASVEELRAALGGALPEGPTEAGAVIRGLAEAADPGLAATASARFFGFVIGGALPVTVAADWLTTAWDQNTGLHAVTPAAAVVEEVAAAWLLELLGLPAGASVGFVTGGQMANFTALAAGRHAVLRNVGWDVEAKGLQGAPRVRVVVGGEGHVTIYASLRMLGLGTEGVVVAEADSQGRLRPDALKRVLGGSEGPTIVCAQAGNVNTGAFDPVDEIVEISRRHRAWVHVDGAFGLWAGASPSTRELVAGIDGADSWSTDAHKWLNVPYDSGVAIVADPTAHQGAMAARASYLLHSEVERDPFDWTPEFSRRARGFPLYAALRSLGRRGVAALVEEACARARQFARRLGAEPGVRVLNEVVLNQVLVRFHGPRVEEDDDLTQAVIRRVQAEGTCWLGGSRWHDQEVMRISVSNWATSPDDVERSADAILVSCRRELAARGG